MVFQDTRFMVTGSTALLCGTCCQEYVVLQDKWSLKTGFTVQYTPVTLTYGDSVVCFVCCKSQFMQPMVVCCPAVTRIIATLYHIAGLENVKVTGITL